MANLRLTRTEVGPAFNEGARLLWKALAEKGWSQADLRRRLRVRRPDGSLAVLATGIVTHWLYGDRRPDIEILVQIEDLLGVPATAWARPPKGRFVPPALKRTGTDG
jgi:transcriptional regulator with XRE-family HTH domain